MSPHVKKPALLAFVAALLLSGCVGTPEAHRGAWPWEYDKGREQDQTGDHFSFRAGVASFSEPPKAAKPINIGLAKTDTREQPPSSPSTQSKSDNATEITLDIEKVETAKNRYDFTIKEIKSLPATGSYLTLNMESPSYDITAYNNGDAPVSVMLEEVTASSRNCSFDKPLPCSTVVPAHSERVLAHVSAANKDLAFTYRYSYFWNLGSYTAEHNCPEMYRVPFGEKVRAHASVPGKKGISSYTRHAIIFSAPKGAVVLASRKGIVVRIQGNESIDVLHEDGTIGTYNHLGGIDKAIVVGKVVTTDAALGVAGNAADGKDSYIQFAVWRPEASANSSENRGFEWVSFPLMFSGADAGKGKVLTQNQVVSRGALLPKVKQTKRK